LKGLFLDKSIWFKKRPQVVRILLGLILITGLVALFAISRIPSDSENAWMFGFSHERILIIGALICALMFLGLVELFSFFHWVWWQNEIKRIDAFITSKSNIFWLFSLLYLLLILIAVPVVVGFSTAIRDLVIFNAIVERFGIMILWVIFTLIILGVILFICFHESIIERRIFLSEKISLWVIFFLAVSIYSLQIANEISYQTSNEYFGIILILLVSFFLAWWLLNHRFARNKKLLEWLNYLFLALSIFIVTYLVYQHFAYLWSWVRTPGKAYWQFLTQAFLNGKLYLTSPAETHDLTFYLGHWYLPPPPLPAFMMIPDVLILGSGNVNNVIFSIFFCSINSMIVFFILDQLRKREWIKLSRMELLWLVVLFAFGTPHWWLGTIGMEWFVSQILAVTFMALAIFCGLKAWSPWLVGLCLGLAMASRPNLFVIWPFLLAISIQIVQDGNNGKLDWKWLVKWISKSALPVIAVVIGLLLYNYLRFGNPLDFGFININGATTIVENVRKYGIYNIHFIPNNLNVMLFKLPSIRSYSPYLFPSLEGMSIIVTTPALLYLIHKYEKKWWIIGAWVTVALSVILLSMYSNTGAAQFGYKYVLDFIVPLIMLLAVALGRKSSWLFRVLVVLSVMINAFGVWWFIQYA
jgi:hypothetical protein